MSDEVSGPVQGPRVQREFSPDFQTKLTRLVTADGSTSVTVGNATALDELGLVNNTYVKNNTNPKHPAVAGKLHLRGLI